MTWTLAAGLVVIAIAVFAVVRRVDVRLALLAAALAMGLLAGRLPSIIYKFFGTFADEKYLVPICSAMGFAYVLRHTQCDQHLVQLLVKPLRRVGVLLIPGAVLVGFLVNIPVISQTSTAVAIGSVLVPLMLAARISPLTVGAALLLGSSVGGELLNPGAPELQTVVMKANEVLGPSGKLLNPEACVARIFPLNVVQLLTATAIFWLFSVRAESQVRQHSSTAIHEPGNKGSAGDAPVQQETPAEKPECTGDLADSGKPPFRVNLFCAAVPLLPLVLLLLSGPPLRLLSIPEIWLDPDPVANPGRFNGRLVGAAMILGAIVATLTAPRKAWGTTSAFFEGAGYAFTHVISLIVTAACFGEGVQQIGLEKVFGKLIETMPQLLFPTAGILPLSFAGLCGSGMASTQSLISFFAKPAFDQGIDPAHIGAVVSIAAAAGRTMSPFAAVTLMSALLTRTNPFDLAKRVALPLLIATTATVLVAMLWPHLL